ncbi:MAG: hypothetical protein M1121_03955 [Actinobacteria bacterium]|nr:hypothetical protein [Actinomycetota bacterium]
MPLAVGIPILALWIIGESNVFNVVRYKLTFLVAFGVTTAQVLAFLAAMRRYAVGDTHTHTLLYFERGWQPPLGSVVIAMLFVLGIVSWASFLGMTSVNDGVGVSKLGSVELLEYETRDGLSAARDGHAAAPEALSAKRHLD